MYNVQMLYIVSYLCTIVGVYSCAVDANDSRRVVKVDIVEQTNTTFISSRRRPTVRPHSSVRVQILRYRPYYARSIVSIMPGRTWRDTGHKARACAREGAWVAHMRRGHAPLARVEAAEGATRAGSAITYDFSPGCMRAVTTPGQLQRRPFGSMT